MPSVVVLPMTREAAERLNRSNRVTSLKSESDGDHVSDSYQYGLAAPRDRDVDETVDNAWQARFEDLESALRNKLNRRPPAK